MIDSNHLVVYNVIMVHKLSAKRKENQRQYYKRWYKENGRKRNHNSERAMSIVHIAVKSGKIIKPILCERCNETKRLYAHHKDYSKPLEVLWLCASCHKITHQIDPPVDTPYIPRRGSKPIDKEDIVMYNNDIMSAKFIDLDNLRIAIREMTYQQGLYKVLRDELKSKGYWRSKPRGNPKLGYQNMKKAKD